MHPFIYKYRYLRSSCEYVHTSRGMGPLVLVLGTHCGIVEGSPSAAAEVVIS